MKILDFAYHNIGYDKLNYLSHSHPQSIEIIQVINGDGVFCIDNKQYDLKNDWIFLVNGNNLHFSSPKNISNYCRNKIIVETKDLSIFLSSIDCTSIIEQLFNHKICLIPTKSQILNIDLIFKKINDIYSIESQNKQLLITTMFFELLCELVNIEKTDRKINNLSANIMDYIYQHISETINLDNLCLLHNISKSGLCHKFKTNTGMTILEYTLQLRLSLAKKQLIETDTPIIDISYNYGFSTFAYFCSIFKKYEKTTPSQYRKQNSTLKNINKVII